ncbi:methylenetetrahydrofolate dehydrogenase [Kockovaella imperatae]|uniref:Methylenetetrahydrofolate dehydrogenase n=1 Tax=Kockovaella imperatae TaxID=4999 RepID=A0A1Y1UPF2_9TREE|nr:methylenetetrahydrofolate dehydrogenase [Kockovaella imperatae]ORX39015.1 methylenetetrahydrofolate dehydrogenase [Kockovaella imperatae]
MADTAPQGLLVTAGKVHVPFKTELLNTLASPRFSTKPPHLVGILATRKEDARTYAEFTKRSCEQVGITFELRLVGEAREGMDHGGVGIDVEEAILEANNDREVDGIMVYYPIYGGRQDQYLQSVLSPLKDVEGLNHQFLFNLYHNIRFIHPLTLRAPSSASTLPLASPASGIERAPEGTVKSVLPCTPLAIVKVLEHIGVYNRMLEYGDRARGKVITVINRSEVVGRPLAALLANDGARVLSVDIDSIVEFSKRPSSSTQSSQFNAHHIVSTLPDDFKLANALAISDVVISAVPVQSYKVPTKDLKDGCICVNVAGEKNFEKDVRERASIYVPSVGVMTIAMLQRNLLRLCEYQDEAKRLGA